MRGPLLAVDAGNSRLKFGLFYPSRSSFYRRDPFSRGDHRNVIKLIEAAGEFPSCQRFLAVPTGEAIPWSTLAGWLPEAAIVSGSNGHAVDRIISEWSESKLPVPLVVKDRHAIAVSVDVDSPDKVGIDRLLNAVAANALRPANRSAIVIDSGTATTVNYLSQDGVFCGGAILPGLEMSAKALNHYTAALPLIPVAELGGPPPIAPGRNTRDAIRSGLLWGQVGAIRELVCQICRQKKLSEPDFSGQRDPAGSPWLVLTGGGGPVLSSQFPGVLNLPSLGMHGLVLTAWSATSGSLGTTAP